jgi:GT2 family glycosyltransferase
MSLTPTWTRRTRAEATTAAAHCSITTTHAEVCPTSSASLQPMKAAVVILNWNGLEFLQRFLSKCSGATVSEHGQVYVADNGSTDGSVDYVRSHHPEVQIIETGGNFGYAGGYNRALAQIKEPYAVLLNSDVEVAPDWLKPLLDLMEHDKNVAALSTKNTGFRS